MIGKSISLNRFKEAICINESKFCDKYIFFMNNIVIVYYDMYILHVNEISMQFLGEILYCTVLDFDEFRRYKVNLDMINY